jgi:hypothetical protein
MSNVVHLKWGEKPETNLPYLMITRLSRVRGDDYYVKPCEGLSPPPSPVDEPRSFASLTSALRRAEAVANQCDVELIYVRLNG